MQSSTLDSVDSWLTRAKTLANRQKALERECDHYRFRYKDKLVYDPKKLGKRFQFLETQEIAEFENGLNQDIIKWQKQLSLLRKHALEASNQLKVKGSNLKSLTLFEGLLKKLKDTENVNIFRIESEVQCLDSFLCTFGAKVDTWATEKVGYVTKEGNGRKCDNKPPNKEKKEITDMTILQIVQKIDRDIAKDGGKTGHWQQDDHNAFLRAYLRVKNNANSVRVLFSCRKHDGNLRHKSDEDISDHFKWYQIYLERCSRKSDWVKKWRDEKLQSQNTPPVDTIDQAHTPDKMERKVSDEHRAQTRAMIHSWREEKKRRTEAENIIKMQQEKEKENLSLQSKFRRQMKIKQLITEYRLSKDNEATENTTEEHSQNQAYLTPADLEARRKKELGIAKEKFLQAKKSREGASRSKYLKNMAPIAEVSAKRDSYRLHKHTKCSANQAQSELERVAITKESDMVCAHSQPIALGARDLNVMNGIRRATPTWRKGI